MANATPNNPPTTWPDMLATCCVPWTDRYELDEPIFRQALRGIRENGTRQLYIFGTAGEGHAVSESQFDQVVDVFISEMQDADPMVGVISNSLPQVLDRIERTAAKGVSSFQISLPAWGCCTKAETARFFEAICGAYPQLRFTHYNVRRAGRLVTLDEYEVLAEQHPNLVAVKFTGTTISDLLAMRYRATRLRIYLTEFAFTAATLHGLQPGLLVSLSSMNWREAHRFYNSAVSGDHGVMLQLAEQLHQIAELMHAAVDGQAHMDNAFDAIFARMMIQAFPLRALPPYQAISPSAFDSFLAAVAARFPDWLPTADHTQVFVSDKGKL